MGYGVYSGSLRYIARGESDHARESDHLAESLTKLVARGESDHASSSRRFCPRGCYVVDNTPFVVTFVPPRYTEQAGPACSLAFQAITLNAVSLYSYQCGD